MKRSALVIGGAIALLTLLVMTGCVTATSNPVGQQTGISVNGEGKVKETPDLAIVRLGFEIKAKTVAEAQSQATSSMQGVVEALKALGLEDKDIQTSRFSIFPEPQFEDRKEVGILYRVTNVVTARVRQLDRVGEILDAAITAGANRVEGLSFTVEDPTPIMEQAREKAVEDAKAKAEQLAKLAGVKVGKLTAISESGVGIPFEIMAEAALPLGKGGGMPTPISPGETEVRLNVHVTYEIAK